MINKYFCACVDLFRKERNTIILILPQGSLVYLAKRIAIINSIKKFFETIITFIDQL